MSPTEPSVTCSHTCYSFLIPLCPWGSIE
uniref:Uncharacterized protein n=1 Tax=Arundo donax TaxID=35708 RepID=A0A0A8Y9S8_ARUDO